MAEQEEKTPSMEEQVLSSIMNEETVVVETPEAQEEPAAEEKPAEEPVKEEPKAEEPKSEESQEESDLSDEDKKTIEKLNEIAAREGNEEKTDDEIREIYRQELDSSLKDEAPKGEEPTQGSKQDFDVNAFVKEQTQGKFESFEDMLAKVSEEPKNMFASERIQKLNDLESKGVDIEQVLKYQALGIEKLDPANVDQAMEILKHEMRMNEPGFTERQMDSFLTSEYKLNDEDAEEGEIEIAKMKLTRAARIAQNKLSERAKELELPKHDPGVDPVAAAKKREEAEMQRKQDQENWRKGVNASLADYSAEKFELNDDRSFEFKLDSDQIKDLSKVMSTPVEFLQRYKTKEGFNTDLFRKDMMLITNQDKIFKALDNMSYNKSTKDIVTSWKRPSQKGSVKSSNKGKSIEQQIADDAGHTW
jgi:hypothetical protein